MNENSAIGELKGIGPKTEQVFSKLGIVTIGDLLRYFPRGYDVYEKPTCIGEAEEGKTITITGTIFGSVSLSGNRSMQVTTIHLKDLTGTMRVIWFRMPFLKNTLRQGSLITVRGRVVNKGNTGDGASGDFLTEYLI